MEMVEMKHTAGEWEVMGSSDPRFRTLAIKEFSEEQTKAPVIGIFDAEHRTIAYIATTAETVAEDEANARLIVASPDLAAFANLIIHYNDVIRKGKAPTQGQWEMFVKQARDAHSKATAP